MVHKRTRLATYVITSEEILIFQYDPNKIDAFDNSFISRNNNLDNVYVKTEINGNLFFYSKGVSWLVGYLEVRPLIRNTSEKYLSRWGERIWEKTNKRILVPEYVYYLPDITSCEAYLVPKVMRALQKTYFQCVEEVKAKSEKLLPLGSARYICRSI